MTTQQGPGMTTNLLNIGEPGTFDQLFRVYYAPLCHFAGSFLSSEEEAQDLIEDLFIKLWQKEQLFENIRHAQAFLYRCARNACLNYRKHGQRTVVVYEELIADTDLMEADHLSRMIKSEVWGEIYRAIAGLPAQCSKVITMSYLDGKSNSEIAAELGLSVQTVKNHKVRGLNLLKDILPGQLFLLLFLYTHFK